MSSKQYELEIFESPGKVYRRAAEIFVRQATVNVAEKDIFTVVLSGGKTPQGSNTLSTSPFHQRRSRSANPDRGVSGNASGGAELKQERNLAVISDDGTSTPNCCANWT